MVQSHLYAFTGALSYLDLTWSC